MVFLVFLEVLEMSSEVVGPGPNTREIKSLRADPGPLACGGFPPGAPSWRPSRRLGSALSLFFAG